ncbi:MAG: hypothetical protein ACP6IY_16845 [Promethearchaeia archaeon]
MKKFLISLEKESIQIFSAIVGAFCLTIHFIIRYGWFAINAVLNYGLRDAGTTIDPLPYWFSIFFIFFIIFYIMLQVDKRFILKINTPEYKIGLYPWIICILFFIPLDFIFFGEFFYKRLIYIPIIIFFSAFLIQSLLLFIILNNYNTERDFENTKANFKISNKKNIKRKKLRIILRIFLFPIISFLFLILLLIILNFLFFNDISNYNIIDLIGGII